MTTTIHSLCRPLSEDDFPNFPELSQAVSARKTLVAIRTQFPNIAAIQSKLDPNNSVLSLNPNDIFYGTQLLPHQLIKQLAVQIQKGDLNTLQIDYARNPDSDDCRIYVSSINYTVNFEQAPATVSDRTSIMELLSQYRPDLENYELCKEYNSAHFPNHTYDFVETKRLSFKLPASLSTEYLRCFFIIVIDDYIVQWREVVPGKNNSRVWSCSLTDYSWTPHSIPFSQVWFKLVMLQPATISSPTCPTHIDGNLRALCSFATNPLREFLSHVQVPLEQPVDDQYARNWFGQLHGMRSKRVVTTSWNAYKFGPPSYFQGFYLNPDGSSCLESVDDLPELINIPFTLPGFGDSEFLLQVNRRDESLSELELAICLGDFERVAALIRAMQNSTLTLCQS